MALFKSQNQDKGLGIVKGVINGFKNNGPDIGAQIAELMKKRTLLKGLELG